MKKSLSLAIFLLSSSSLLHAKGGLDLILGGPEENLHLGITHAIKKQKIRVLDEFRGSPVLQELKEQYERQIRVLKNIREHSSIPASSSEPSSSEHLGASAEGEIDLDIHLYHYNNAKTQIKVLKKQLTPEAKLQLKTSFASLPLEGASVENVRYGIALKDVPNPALESFQAEFHKHDYHQFIEWKNYALYLTNAATRLKEQGHLERSMEYNIAAFRIYEEILPVKNDAFKLLRGKKLPARLYNARTQTTEELGGLLTTDELLESAYYEGGNLALTLCHTEPALNFLLWSRGLARANKIDRPYLPYLIAHGFHDFGEETRDLKYFQLAVTAYDEYFKSDPKTINLDYYIKAAGAALSAEKTVEAESWMRKVIDTLNVTEKSDQLAFKRTFRTNAQTLAGIAYKAGDFRTALYFYEGILQNEAILNQSDVNSSMQYYNAGSMAYLAKDYAKARFYLSKVNRQDPLLAADTRTGESIDVCLQEIAAREGQSL